MKLRNATRQEPDINLTPLIDVVFLLLIFFMVSTTFTKTSEITIELPEASTKPVEAEQKPVEIVIDKQGSFYVNNKLVVNTKIETLKEALRLATADLKKPALVISADGETPHQSVVTAMDAARQLGITHLSISTKHSGSRR